jgi:hypothetical protein
MIALLLLGCPYRVTLTSDPTPAQLVLPDGSAAVTPLEAKLRWAPFSKQEVVATAPGYRPLTVDLRDHEIRLWRLVGTTLFRPATIGGAPRGEVELVLVPDHGPAGTWTEDQVP